MNNPSNGSATVSVDLGPVSTGLWCQRCQLPSGWTAPLLSICSSGVSVIGTVARCDDGDHPLGLPGDLA